MKLCESVLQPWNGITSLRPENDDTSLKNSMFYRVKVGSVRKLMRGFTSGREELEPVAAAFLVFKGRLAGIPGADVPLN